MPEVERVGEGLSVEEFMETYWAEGRPVVITGAVKNWLASTEWSLESLSHLAKTRIFKQFRD